MRNILSLSMACGVLADFASLFAGFAFIVYGALHAKFDHTHIFHVRLVDPGLARYFLLLTVKPLLATVLFETWLLVNGAPSFKDAVAQAPDDASVQRWHRFFRRMPSVRWHVRICAMICVYTSITASLVFDPYPYVVWYNLVYVGVRALVLFSAHEVTLYEITHTKLD
jgi:hypothetical protein